MSLDLTDTGNHETLPVIFRKERSGEWKGQITAVFPTLPFGYSLRDGLTCYVGQHSACSFAWYWQTVKAKPEEYADLLNELKAIYENPDDDPVILKVYQKMTSKHGKAFRALIPA